MTDALPDPAETFSPAELATLARLADAFVPGGGEHRGRRAAAALAVAGEPGQVRQLRLALRLIESRPANLALTGRATPFSAMSDDGRERYLLAWRDSRLALRAGFAAFRKLLTFLAYAGDRDDPEVGTRLARIGYRQDERPVAPDPGRVAAFPLPARTGPNGTVVLEADVVVVGSGAGGGVVAADLARAGRSVVVLEAGPLATEAEMPDTEQDAFDRLYLDRGLTATADAWISILAGSAVGGGTLVNWMTSIDSPPDVRARWAMEHGIDGWDAPAAERDVEAIERELGVAPVVAVPPKDDVLLRGGRVLGWDAEPIRRDGAGCTGCGSCGFGCRAGTKQSGIRAHLADAVRHRARVVPDARVEKVLLAGGRARGVVATVGGGYGTSGRPLVVRAPQVVMAAGALRTPGILARSGLDHPAIGRYLRIHPVPVVAGRFDDPVEMWRGTLQGVRIAEFLRPERGRNTYLIESVPGHPGLIALAFGWDGAAAHASLMDEARFLSPLIAVTQDGGEGRVTPTRSGGSRIDYRLDRVGVATLRHALVSMARVARAAGAADVAALGPAPVWASRERSFDAFLDRLRSFDFGPNRGLVFSAHQMGTARMGGDPRDHACDPAGRVRQDRSGQLVRGLYVADGSLFPTALGVNPMITIMALARRVARTVGAEGSAARG